MTIQKLFQFQIGTSDVLLAAKHYFSNRLLLLYFFPTFCGSILAADTSKPAHDEIQETNLRIFTSLGNLSNQIHQVLTEPLFVLSDDEDHLYSFLIENYIANADGIEWAFTLQSDITWNDGEVLDTEDVLFSFDTVLGTALINTPNAFNLRAQVESVVAVDTQTFTVTLREPNLRFPHQLLTARPEGTFTLWPEHVWAGKVDDYIDWVPSDGLEPYIGSGPYILENVVDDDATFVRNPDWWGATTGFEELPEPEKVILKSLSDIDDAVELLKLSELDIGPELDRETFFEVVAENNDIIAWATDTPYPWPGPCTRQIDFNTMDPVWKDVSLRQAAAHFVDQSSIIEDVFAREAIPAQTLFPPHPALATLIEAIVDAGHAMPNVADTSQGHTILQAAGYERNAEGLYFDSDGKNVALKIQVAQGTPDDMAVAQTLAAQLSAQGIAAEVAETDGAELWTHVLPLGKFQAVYSSLGCGSLMDPLASMSQYHSKYAVPIGSRSPGGRNMGRWNSQRAMNYGTLIDALQIAVPGSVEAEENAVEAYGLVARDIPFIPIVHENSFIPFSSARWNGWPSLMSPHAMPIWEWNQFPPIVHKLEEQHEN